MESGIDTARELRIADALAGYVMDRRQESKDMGGCNRRRLLRGHHIQVGTTSTKPGWMVGQCECGDHAEATVDHLVEAWASWHRDQIISSN